MKKPGNKRKGSVYCRKVSPLFTKAGAFGIVNLFNHYNETNEYASVKGKAIHHNEISTRHEELIKDNLQGVEV